ncbi:MAG TPA: glutamine synthetase III [Chthoniobacteraceae bacterium]|nr:glutamine synthetase III [Chthoniobacteraceae bacterium]
MSASISRLQAINAITNFKPSSSTNFRDVFAADLYGSNVFSPSVMKQRLPQKIYQSVIETIESGAKLDPAVADVVAAAMKDWAIDKGATHYAHVFYPLTGLSAEKHDSFLSPDGLGNTITEFSGKTLIQGEPDASSLPSGGMRSTFEARGYTVWDVTSPAYVLENPNGSTLCIPTAFISWTGDVLDNKTPLLRAMQVLHVQARRILKLFGHEKISHIKSTAGAEQEYFLIDRNFYYARPDLLTAGRTLFGARPPKGQEFEDHYFGAIPERVLAYMMEVERELFKLGIPIKTRHNEVAPGQFEIAPVFENSNLASDHQQLVMAMLRTVAERSGMACLLHEKPFAGVSGSGKHVNFSLGNSTQGNLLDPGDTPHANAQFLVFCTAVIRAVSLHAELLRAVVASAGNDHRLGANEAPPAIVSIFLGDQLSDVFEQISRGGANTSKQRGTINIGADCLPPLPKDAGDRNRTSPFAFTGNKFEFRAVGSNQSISGVALVFNTILAESLDYIATELEKAEPGRLNERIQQLLHQIINEHKGIIFNGNNYSEKWVREAAERGLPNHRTAVEAIPAYTLPTTVAAFERFFILTGRELESRQEIAFEQYVKTINVEANLFIEVGRTIIYPAAVRYQSELAANAARLKELKIDPDLSVLEKVSKLIADLLEGIEQLETARANRPVGDFGERARYALKEIIPAMEKVRAAADELEGIVADDLWLLPTYQEMLFIK